MPITARPSPLCSSQEKFGWRNEGSVHASEGWEGTARDALVLRDALERENGLRVPEGKFYLVDAGYGAKPGFLPPFRGVRYHLNEWGNNPVQNEKELFNHRHSSLRACVKGENAIRIEY
jgi:hypothetical protein